MNLRRLPSLLLALGIATTPGLLTLRAADGPATATTTATAPTAAPATPAAANPKLTDIVDDQTAIALVVDDVPALVKGWDASPFARTWNDEQVVKYFAPVRDLMKMDTWDDQAKAATGKTIRELLALAKGQALVSLPATAINSMFAEKQDTALPLLLAIELGDNAAVVEKLAADASAKDENLHIETTSYAGTSVHTSLPPVPKAGVKPVTPAPMPTVTAMCQGIWLISPNYGRVCAAIDAIKAGGVAKSLGRSENYLRAKQRAGSVQLLGYVNFPAIYPVLLAQLKKAEAEDTANRPPPGAGASPSAAEPEPFTPEGLLTGLGVDALHDMVYTLNFGEKDTRITGGLDWGEERGLVKLLAYGPGAATRPEWVSSKWVSVASAKFDVRAAYASLEDMLLTISPQISASVQGEIKNEGDQMGIDIKRDLIGSLGSDLIVATALPAGADPTQPPALDKLDTLYALALDNPETFTKAFTAIRTMLMGTAADAYFTKRDYLGQTLYTYSPPTPAGVQPGPNSGPGASGPGAGGPGGPPEPADQGPRFSYAIANHMLLIGVGSPAILETTLQGMAEKRDNFWDKPEVKTTLAGIPDAASGIQVQDMRVMVLGIMGVFANLPLPIGPNGSLVDETAKPDSARIARYWGLGYGYTIKDGKSIYSESRIANPKP